MAAPRKKKEAAPAPEPRIPHPRRAAELVGHHATMASFEQAWNMGRFAHAWLLTGARGIGKATLAYQLARRILAWQEGDAALPPLPAADHPISRRVMELSHADFRAIMPTADSLMLADDKKKPSHDISIDQVRELSGFMHLTSGESAWRVILVDPAEAMNLSAANALLKMLEEPPARTVMLLVSHAPGRLLPTIRSRCRMLPVAPLSAEDARRVLQFHAPDAAAEDVALLSAIADGSPGLALQLHAEDAAKLFRQMLAAMHSHKDALALAEKLSARQEDDRWPTITLLARCLHQQLTLAAATGQSTLPEPERSQLITLSQRHPVATWNHRWESLTRLWQQDAILHLDRRLLLFEALC